MTAVEWGRALTATLGPVAPLLSDSLVEELLLPEPGIAWVTRGGRRSVVALEAGPDRLTAMARRLRSLLRLERGGAGDGVVRGLLADTFLVSIVGPGPRDAAPKLRFLRVRFEARTLEALGQEGRVDKGSLLVASESARRRRSLVIAGPKGSGKSSLLSAVVGAWIQQEALVVALETPGDRRLSRGWKGVLSVDPRLGPEAAVALGADAIAADEPAPDVWLAMLRMARPFLATMEAPDARAARRRLVSAALSGPGALQRGEAEDLVAASVELLVEVGGRGLSPATPSEDLPSMPGRPPTADDLAAASGLAAGDSEFDDAPVSEIRADELVSLSVLADLGAIEGKKGAQGAANGRPALAPVQVPGRRRGESSNVMLKERDQTTASASAPLPASAGTAARVTKPASGVPPTVAARPPTAPPRPLPRKTSEMPTIPPPGGVPQAMAKARETGPPDPSSGDQDSSSGDLDASSDATATGSMNVAIPGEALRKSKLSGL